jgi:hypothetical protein
MVSMYPFVKSLRKADHTRRYSIQATSAGWEVREERDSEIVRHSYYQDWHRVERALQSFSLKLNVLRQEGWSDL